MARELLVESMILAAIGGALGLASAYVSLRLLVMADPADVPRLVNISTRGLVQTGDNVMIGGFIIGGDESTQVMVRAIGPSLTNFGVAGALPDPTLELHTSDGSLIYENDDWRGEQEQLILYSGLAPTDDHEAAIIATLPPGNYTAIIRGRGNNTGVALVEVYNLENP